MVYYRFISKVLKMHITGANRKVGLPAKVKLHFLYYSQLLLSPAPHHYTHKQTARLKTAYCARSRSELITNMQKSSCAPPNQYKAMLCTDLMFVVNHKNTILWKMSWHSSPLCTMSMQKKYQNSPFTCIKLIIILYCGSLHWRHRLTLMGNWGQWDGHQL